MLPWETEEERRDLEFAQIWRTIPKLVFSTTLDKVEGNATLAAGDVADEVAELRQEPGKDISVGGAGFASTLVDADLIDEYRLFVSPVVLGGGTPYFPARQQRLEA